MLPTFFSSKMVPRATTTSIHLCDMTIDSHVRRREKICMFFLDVSFNGSIHCCISTQTSTQILKDSILLGAKRHFSITFKSSFFGRLGRGHTYEVAGNQMCFVAVVDYYSTRRISNRKMQFPWIVKQHPNTGVTHDNNLCWYHTTTHTQKIYLERKMVEHEKRNMSCLKNQLPLSDNSSQW